jgi:hypothetical protein
VVVVDVVVVGAGAAEDGGPAVPALPITRPAWVAAGRDGTALPPLPLRKNAARASDGAASPPAIMRNSRVRRPACAAGA